MAQYQKKMVLVTVKAYPQESKRYRETVCVAGICLNDKKWIRLYPLPFRFLEDAKQFKKYEVIEVEVTREGADPRPESHKIRQDTLRVIEHWDTEGNWKKRKECVLPTLSNSMCEILREEKAAGKSLGAFKLKRPTKFYWKKVDLTKPGNEEEAEQLLLFDNQKSDLEKLPYSFHYEYTCENESACPGHNQIILDWEIGGAFRRWRVDYGSEENALPKIREKWLDEMFAADKDPIVFVGNHHRFTHSFMILGVFYPKYEPQLSLFDMSR
jgi:hypothetical protein